MLIMRMSRASYAGQNSTCMVRANNFYNPNAGKMLNSQSIKRGSTLVISHLKPAKPESVILRILYAAG